MREIKFMVWNQELNEMYEIKKMNYFGSVGIVDNLACGESAIWLPYTGLKDAGGCDIYDGDILDDGHLYIVEWDNENALFTLKVPGSSYNEPMYEYNIQDMLIVGNIYKNKNLLEEK